MKHSDIITQYFKKEKIDGIDIILHNSKESKVFRKLLTKSIKYQIPYFKNIKKGKVLRSNNEIIAQCHLRKFNLIEEFSQKICLKTTGIKNTSQIESIIENENKKLFAKLKDVDLVISILDEIYDDKKLNKYFMEKIRDRKKVDIDIIDLAESKPKQTIDTSIQNTNSLKKSEKLPLFINEEDIESRVESEESTISLDSENMEEMKGGKRYNISYNIGYLAEYSNQVESIMSKE